VPVAAPRIRLTLSPRIGYAVGHRPDVPPGNDGETGLIELSWTAIRGRASAIPQDAPSRSLAL
jgi:hypothetical protein